MVQAARENSANFLVSTFVIKETLFGIDTMKVQEVIRVGDITPVHHAQDYIVGIINLRGKIVTILDLSQKIGLEKTSITAQTRIIIVDWNNEYIGLLVDGVSDVVDVERAKIGPPPSNVPGVQSRYFEGVYQSENRRLISILLIDEVLGESEG